MLGKEFIADLIGQMTLQEKAAEMTQLWGENPDGTLMGILRGFHENEHLAANAGSVLGFSGAERVLNAQRIHIEENAHHIPFLFMTDVIHGYRTVFPSVLGLGATWNPSLVEETASAAAAEAAVAGVHVTFSPMADLVRDARWGRVVESTGEDPYLNSLFTAAFTKGYQGNGADKPLKIACCAKHFVGYGAVEGGRDYDGVQISNYQLYNEYLPPFQAAFDAGCEMLMPGFHTLNGIPCTANRHLLYDILREYMDFKGIIISDCTAVCELIPHGVCENSSQAATLSIQAGLDIEMVSSTFYENAEKLVNEGIIPMEQIDEAVERILSLKDKLGLFENPYKDADAQKEKKLHLCPTHRALARKSVSESIVLLKNAEHALPLAPDDSLALIGPFADSRQFLDIWGAINGKEEDCVTLREALEGYAPAYAPGCHLWSTKMHGEECPSDEDWIREAVATAAKSEKIILALGEHPDMSAEAGSRTDLKLPCNQLALLKALAETGKPIITVVVSGRPLVLGEVAENSAALLTVWFPGTEGGHGIADILTGRHSPVGRLPISFPKATGQVPLYYNHMPTGRPSTSNRYNAFTNGYIDVEPGPLYPFGYGLSYTQFTYSPVALSASFAVCKDASEKETALLTASVKLTNIGDTVGTETVQLYIWDMVGTYSRPVRMLKGFQKITLASKESQTITFSILPSMLEYYIPGKGTVLEPGTFRIYVGAHAQADNYAEFTLKGGY